jgi:hypothetical protein
MPPDVDWAFWVDEGEGEFKGFAVVESDADTEAPLEQGEIF